MCPGWWNVSYNRLSHTFLLEKLRTAFHRPVRHISLLVCSVEAGFCGVNRILSLGAKVPHSNFLNQLKPFIKYPTQIFSPPHSRLTLLGALRAFWGMFTNHSTYKFVFPMRTFNLLQRDKRFRACMDILQHPRAKLSGYLCILTKRCDRLNEMSNAKLPTHRNLIR